MPLKNFEDLSDEILDMQSRETERFGLMYERLANQDTMTEEEQEALESEVNGEVEVLEKASSKLKKAQRWSSEQADELKTRLKEGKSSESKRRILRRAPANSVIDYKETKTNNFAAGINFYKKTAGIIGTGKIGAAMCRICHGFGMNVIAYDMYPNKSLDFVTYKSLDEVLAQSDLISLHCPLTEDTYHLICRDTIKKMKDNVILVNTSRGALVATNDLIEGIREKKFFGVGLDVYEEEGSNVFENREDEVLQHSTTARLLSFPNVIVTSHQGFLTEEALEAISLTTFENAAAFEKGNVDKNNIVC